MEEEQELMFRESLVIQELELIRSKLKYVRLFKSEKQKDCSSPSSSMSKNENVRTISSELKRGSSSTSLKRKR